jgi:endonuclease G
MPRILAPLLAVLLAAVSALAQVPTPNPNIRFGMPAPAKADPDSREAFLIARPQYVLSYNAKTRTPNWVAWRLRETDIGPIARASFVPDPALPTGSSPA